MAPIASPWPRRRGSDWWGIASVVGLAALALLFAWPLFTPNALDRRWIVAGDFSDQFYPFARYISDELHARRIPLWNPFVFAGHPFQADPQTAVFYPVSTGLAFLLGRGGLPYWGIELELPIHFAIAAIGTFLFAHRVTGSRSGGIVAALAYGFGGFLTSYPAQQLAMLRTAAWLPLVLYGVERSSGAGRDQRWVLCSGVVFALALFAGHTQSAMFIAYLAAGYGLWRGRQLGSSWMRAGLTVAGLLAIGVGLAAVQLVPTVELVSISTRDRLSYDAAAYGYELRALFGALLPGWRGEKALYVGLAPLVLATFALRRLAAPTVFWGSAALLGLLTSTGGHTFLYRLLYLVAPGWSTFRDQERTAAIWSFAVAILAAYGLAAFESASAADVQRWGRRLNLGAIAALALAAEILVLWTARRDAEINPLDSLLDAAVLFVILSALTAGLLGNWYRPPRAVALSLLVGLIIFDLFSVNAGNNLTTLDPQVVFDREAALAVPRTESEPYRVRADDDKVVPPNLGMVWRSAVMDGDSPIQLRRTHDLLDSGEEWRLWQLFNVKYLLSRALRDDPGLERLGIVGDLNVYRVRFSLPRAWAVSDVRYLADPMAVKTAVLSPDAHPGDVAFVEDQPALPIQPGLPRPDVAVVSEWPNGVEIAVRSAGNALLVVADAWHPGWVATLDGAPTPILRTDYALRGVVVPGGAHVVEMRFRPRSLLVGGAVSLAAALAVVGTWMGIATRRRREEGARQSNSI